MLQHTDKIEVKTNGMHLNEITDKVKEWISKINAIDGLLNISIQHTSASLLVQENADPAVLNDLKNFFSELVPLDNRYMHFSEGKDDMPAHIKSALTNTNITLSILNNKVCLGAWQGIYLFEHRFAKKNRILIFHYIGK